jgi:hypothetical protein
MFKNLKQLQPKHVPEVYEEAILISLSKLLTDTLVKNKIYSCMLKTVIYLACVHVHETLIGNLKVSLFANVTIKIVNCP